MGDIVNLQQYRKKLKRGHAAQESAGNRVRHGLTRAARREREDALSRRQRELEGKRLESRPGKEIPPVPGGTPKTR